MINELRQQRVEDLPIFQPLTGCDLSHNLPPEEEQNQTCRLQLATSLGRLVALASFTSNSGLRTVSKFSLAAPFLENVPSCFSDKLFATPQISH